MSNRQNRGFTIIELVLFLGVTGMLFAALMFGVNSGITQQRYKDSVYTYKSLLEEQYAAVSYPRNERDDKWACTAENGVRSEPTGGEARGTSKCVLLGRYVQVKDDGHAVEVGSVVGIQPVDSSSLAGDIATLVSYAPVRSPIDQSDHDVEWQSALQSVDGRPSTASFLILRSPLSGLVRTFALNEPLPVRLAEVLTETTATAHVKNCVVGGVPIGLPTQSITVNASVASANGVEIQGSDEEC